MIQRVVRTCDNNKVTCVLYEETSKERIKGMGSMLPFISYEKLCAEKAPESIKNPSSPPSFWNRGTEFPPASKICKTMFLTPLSITDA